MPLSWKRPLVAAFAALALASSTAKPAPAADPPLTVVRFAVNPHFITFAAVFVAVDKGYFRDAASICRSPSTRRRRTRCCRASRAAISTSTPSCPDRHSSISSDQGFNLKIVGSVDQPRAGYIDGSVLVVRKDVWDAGTIRKTGRSCRGKPSTARSAGSPVSLLTLEAIAAGNLKTSDVKYATREADVGQQFAALNNKVVDVQGTTEPTATAMVAKGVGVKWLSYRDVVPWYQESYWGVSAAFAKDHPDVVAKFLQAYIRGEQEIQKSGGKLTPELIATIAKWTENRPRHDQGARRHARISAASERSTPIRSTACRSFGSPRGLIKTPVPIDRIIDPEPLAAAHKALGIK